VSVDSFTTNGFSTNSVLILKCFYTNADSLMNKRSELLATIEDERLDVICVTEILPKNPVAEIQPVELHIEGFDCFINLQTAQCHRGVAVWVRRLFHAQPFKLDGNLDSTRESLWCEIPLQKEDRLVVGTVYRSLNSDVANNAAVNELLSSVVVG
jgi:exonuclease III